MGRKRSFLGFLATLFMVFFTANAFAAGYSCPTYKKYTSCNAGYYMTASSDSTVFDASQQVGNACIPCSSAGTGCSCKGSVEAPVCSVTVTFKSGNTTLGTQAFSNGVAGNLTAVSNFTAPVSGNGWGFAGWATSVNSTTIAYADAASARFTANTTLYGVWKRTTNFYYYNSSTATSSTSTSPTQYYRNSSTTAAGVTAVTLPALTAHTTYAWTPVGWVRGSTTSTTTYSTSTTATNVSPTADGSQNFYALYSRTATVAYNGNGNTGGSTTSTTGTQYYNTGNTSSAVALNLTLATNGFTRKGCAFSKWAGNSASGTQYAAGTSFAFPNTKWTSTRTYNMYAIWSCMTVSASAKSLTYNGTTPSNGTAQSCATTFTVSGPSSYTATYSASSSGTYSDTAPTLTNVGSTTIYYKIAATGYTPYEGSYTCTMNSKAMTVSANTKTLTYTGSAQSCANVSVSVPSSGATIKYATQTNGTCGAYSATVPTLTNVGTSTVCYQVTGANFTTKTGTYTCEMKQADGSTTIKDNGTTVSQGTTAFPGTKTLTATCAGGATVSSVVSGTASVATASNSGNTITLTSKSVGKSVITVNCPATTNYKASSATYTWTVSPGTITATVSSPSKTYDGTALTCSGISNVSPSGATVTYATKSGTTCGAYSSTIPSRTDTGTTNVCYKISATNYTDKTGEFACTVNSTTGSIVIKDGSTNVTNGSGNTTYPTNKTLTATCPGGEATPTVSSATTSVATATISNGTITLKPVAAGSSEITVNCAKSTNYAATSEKYTLTVNRGTCSISVSPTSGTITYPTTTSTFTIAKGNCNGTLSATSNKTGVATVSVNGTTGTVSYVSAGEATITVKSAQSNQYKEATTTYTARTVAGTISATASDNSKTYNGTALTCDGNINVTAPTSGYTISYGTKDGTYDLTSAPTITNVADSKTIYYKITANNYTAKTGSFKCTVSKANNTLTLSSSSLSMAYGATATFTITKNTSGGALGVVSSATDIATASLSGTTVSLTAGAKYGTSDIVVSSAETANYNAASATFTVVANMGTITLNNQSATPAGTGTIYQTYNTNVYLDSARKNAMTTSANGITTPSKTGHTFGGYYDSTSYGTQYIDANGKITSAGITAGKALKANGTWYAKWTPNAYTVTYSCGTGTGTAPSNGKPVYNQNFTPATNTCTNDGFDFGGWNDGSTIRAAGVAFKWTYTSNKTFTAIWNPKGATTITYNTNGGAISGNYTTSCNVETATFNLPTNVVRAGYTFGGWYNNSGFSGNAITSVPKGTCTGALTFWAKWNPCNSTTAGACNCGASEYPLNGTCTNCTKSCASVSGYTLGEYNVCNSQSDSICYRNCTTADVANSASVSGVVRKGGTKTCAATSCAEDFYLSGAGCQACPENSEDNCGVDAEWSCNAGYEKTTDGLGCKPKTYTINFDDQGATTAGTASITATFDTLVPNITVPKKTWYKFGGYWSSKECKGTQYYSTTGTGLQAWTTAASGTLYACWIVDYFDCAAGKASDGSNCSAGSFCPGGRVALANKDNTTNGCERTCPSAAGKTVTSPSGATANTQCTASGTVDITESTGTTITGSGAKTCSWDGDSYDASCNVVPSSCIGGYWRPADNSPFCNPVGKGYYRGGSANILTRYACANLSGANNTTTTKTETSSAATACYNECSAIKTTDGNGMRNPVNTTENYNGTTIPACSYNAPVCNSGYEPSGDTCVASKFKITLDHNGGSSATNAIYLRYGIEYQDANGNKITTVAKPTKTGETFGGYFSGNTMIVNGSGSIVGGLTQFEGPTTIKASWTNNPTIVCHAGTYYPGTGSVCVQCTAGSYCSGGEEVVQDTGTPGGIKSCASLNGTYTAATDFNGNKLTVAISSPAGSDGADDCVATNVAYAPNQYTAGSQTCHYDATTKSYSTSCDTKVVITCAGGYALASAGALVCSEAGRGFYSPDKETAKSPCPDGGTTQGTTSKSKEECVMDNLWFENSTSGQRRQCFWSDASGAYDLNCPQSMVVTCIAGYWYDSSLFDDDQTTEKYCIPVGEGAYSPAQSDCEGEDEQPTTVGCSTRKHTCPGGALTGKDDAASVLECAGVCPEGSYCVDGVEYSCPDGYTSDAGSDEEGDCYVACEFRCNSTTAITEDRWNTMCSKYNADVCSRSATKTAGVKFYNTNTCVLHPDTEIPLSCLVRVYCDMGDYFTPVGNLGSGKCVSCSTIGNGYENSISGALYSPDSDTGAKACFAEVNLPCTPPVCPLSSRGTCDFVEYTEDNSTTYVEYGGYLFYGESTPVPGPEGVTNFVCPATDGSKPKFTCLPGYDKNEDADIDPTDGSASNPADLCTPHVYTITLQSADGSEVYGYIYQKYKDGWYSDKAANSADKITTVSVPSRNNWTFNGYYSGPGVQVIDPQGRFVTSDAINATYTSDMVLYASWTQNVYQCQAGKYYVGNGTDSVLKDCVAPYYCPGVGTVAVGSTGCRETCPTPQVEPLENPKTNEAGQSDVTSCYADFARNPLTGDELPNGDGTWVCQYRGTSSQGEYANCNVVVNSCAAGYYNQSGTTTCTTPDSGYYSPDGDLVQTRCPQKTNYTIGTDVLRDTIEGCYVVCSSYVPAVEHSTDAYVTAGEEYQKKFWSEESSTYPACHYTVECATGYTAVSGTAPQCKAKEYDITLDKNKGTGNIADSVHCVFDSGECTLPATNVLTRDGYKTANKWCTNANGTGTCYDAGATVATNISNDGTNTTLYAIWMPGVFKINLSAPDADTNANQNPVYLKYATGWFSDADATNEITSIGTNLPSRGGTSYVFAGYKLNDVSIIDASGVLSGSSNALTATTVNNVTAMAVWTLGDTKCDAGYYYPGTGSECNVCPANHWCPGGKFGTDSGTVQGMNECLNDGLSAGGVNATNIGVCYKTGMDYITYIDADKQQPRATGTWTCNYGTTGYTNCNEDTVVIGWCAAGYWYDKTATTIDCITVGADNWSAESELDKHSCPDGGNTNGAMTSDALTDCQKRVNTYVSVTNQAKGSHVCSARQDGSAVKYDQNCQSGTIEINWCAGGYWYDEAQTTTDCVLVGVGRYSPEADLMPHDCPNGGTTTINNADKPDGICQKTKVYPGIEYDGPAVHGTGVHGCLYDSAADGMMFGDQKSDGYVSCGTITMTECNSGYWWQKDKTVCEVVGSGYFGPVADINNSGHPTGRMACPDNGMTQGTKSADATACYLEKLACDITNGSGEQTRFYDNPVVSDEAGYNVCRTNGQVVECDTVCTITGCDTGFSLVEGACINCPADNVCTTEEGQRSCAVATGGTHPKADAGTTDIAYCYADCALGAHAYQMTGRDYFGTNVADTCKIAMCAAGYTLSNGKCVECPAGMICNPETGGDDAPKSCATLTGGEYVESATNSDNVNDCYKVCEPYEVVNGTAVPVSDKAYYPNECEFEGKSTNGNPCEIVDGVCTETSCNYNYEMVGGICKPCAREHAISYKQGGNCIVESCANGYHPNGQQCEYNVIECTAPNAVAATQTWDASKNAFGACMIIECADGYHLGANACQIDEQVCELEHGIGTREWNHKSNTWGECVATECDPGYTNDPSLTNELWKQCGRCNNMYSANGDLAVSSYVQGCEIAACMYQGELYTLENNECRLICDTYSDETGSRRWNASRKKCERTCEPGYTSW